MIPEITEDKRYERRVRGLNTQVQGEVRVRDPKTLEQSMLIAERYDAILFPSRDTYIRIHHAVVPRKHADTMDFDAITFIKRVHRVKLTDAERNLLRKEVPCFKFRELGHTARHNPERLAE